MQVEIIIRPKNNLFDFDFAELWQYRELFLVLAWRDIAVRYRQTLLGVLWAIFQPIVTTGIFSIFFGKIAKIPSNGLPYPLFAFTGLIIWNFFSSGVTNASQSLLSNSSIINKVYFPRIIIPLAAIITSGIDFLITIAMLLVAIFFMGFRPNLFLTLTILPILLIILFLTIAGVGFFTSAVNVRFRDVRYALPFFIQIGLFVTPIIYPLSVIYDYRKFILMLNPLAAVVEGARGLISGSILDFTPIYIALPVSFVLFVVGYFYFKRTEAVMADIS